MVSLVDCKWGEWEAWESCSATCGIGMRQRSRYFDEMAMHGGKNCTGESTDAQMCSAGPCQSNAHILISSSKYSLFYGIFFQSTAHGMPMDGVNGACALHLAEGAHKCDQDLWRRLPKMVVGYVVERPPRCRHAGQLHAATME